MIGYSQTNYTPFRGSDCSDSYTTTTTATGTSTAPFYSINTTNTATSISAYCNDLLQNLNNQVKKQKEDAALQVTFGQKTVDLTDKILQAHKEQEVEFINIIERNPNRVYEFIFQDGTHIKTVCAEEDLEWFSLPYAFYLALAKYLYGKDFTFEGVLDKAEELSKQKKYIKIVKKGLKLFKKQQEEKEKAETEEKRIKAIKKNHYNKNKRRKENKKEKELNSLKNIIIEALNESK